MDIKKFAQKHRVKVNDRRPERKFHLTTSEDTIHGRYGEIVDDPSYGPVFAVKFIAVPRAATMNGALRNRYKKALAGGLALKRVYGDAESTFHFDPFNAQQSALALKLVSARTKRTRILTEDQRRVLADRLRLAMEARRMPVAA